MRDPDLERLERAVEVALAGDDRSGLDVLGYGEISLVLGWPPGAPQWACKRLPPMPHARAEAFAEQVGRYVTELRARGIDVVDTDVRRVDGSAGTVVVYCVQPALPTASLACNVVRADRDGGARVLQGIVDAVFDAVDDRVGLDAQLSNWASDGGRLRYLDITTPLLRRPDGTEELDTELFLASLPWVLRAPVRRAVVPSILDRYHRPRSVVLDLASNLHKERLGEWVPVVLDACRGRVDPPLTVDGVRRDYRTDARTWAALQALRRVDRTWQRRVRRRPYGVLLPARISR